MTPLSPAASHDGRDPRFEGLEDERIRIGLAAEHQEEAEKVNAIVGDLKGMTTGKTAQLLADGLIGGAEFPPLPAEVVASSSRHTVPDSDPTVKFLAELEERYADDSDELAKVLAIRIHPNSVEFSSLGLKLKRTNESAPADGKDVFDNGGHSLFKWEKAMNLFDRKVPSGIQWQTMLDSIPGKTDRKHSENFRTILDVPLAGSRLSIGHTEPIGYAASLWSSSSGCAESIRSVRSRINAPHAYVEWLHQESASSVRCFSDE